MPAQAPFSGQMPDSYAHQAVAEPEREMGGHRWFGLSRDYRTGATIAGPSMMTMSFRLWVLVHQRIG
jgi:hypothetical protein